MFNKAEKMQSVRRWLLTSTASVLMVLAASAQQDAATLTVKLSNIGSEKGKIMLALFQQPEGFPFVHQKAFRLQQVAARPGDLTVSFPQLPAGRYALAVYHDENADMKLNTNALGIPREGYGFSRNIRPKFSAPKFEEAAFDLARSSQMSVEVKY
jgi:uncharacterized protein (DUF2141 family)